MGLPASTETDFDVVVVGAGLSGVGAGYHLQTRSPDRSYVILESRDALGGTWDLFRYPGIRSDSDMYTFGYAFRPWTGGKVFADGPAIKEYVRATAEVAPRAPAAPSALQGLRKTSCSVRFDTSAGPPFRPPAAAPSPCQTTDRRG